MTKELKEYSVHRDYVVTDVVTILASSKKEARKLADDSRTHGTLPEYLFPVHQKVWLVEEE